MLATAHSEGGFASEIGSTRPLTSSSFAASAAFWLRGFPALFPGVLDGGTSEHAPKTLYIGLILETMRLLAADKIFQLGSTIGADCVGLSSMRHMPPMWAL